MQLLHTSQCCSSILTASPVPPWGWLHASRTLFSSPVVGWGQNEVNWMGRVCGPLCPLSIEGSSFLGQKDGGFEGRGWKESDREGICLDHTLSPAPSRCPLWEPAAGCSCLKKATVCEVQGKESGSVRKTKGNIKNQPAPPEESGVV